MGAGSGSVGLSLLEKIIEQKQSYMVASKLD
jgi:hypothetical protein